VRPARSFLDRFRRGLAVPAAAGDELAAELAPVFSELEQVEREADGLRKLAVERAQGRLASGAEQAARISASWRERAEAEREQTIAHTLREVEQEARAILVAGEAEAARIRERGRARVADLVSAVVSCVTESPP
jgi:vacuolar-type H+-ATPase subunit H